jgi:iron-sulfur cluster assembly accessory protein
LKRTIGGRTGIKMIKIEPTAKSAIENVEMPPGYSGIRIKVQKAGCNGHTYAMEWCNNKEDHDFLIQTAAKDVYIDMLYLAGSHLVYKQDKFQEGFEFINPNETAKCGCGESFYVA